MITNLNNFVNESLAAHFALQNTKFGNEKGKVQKGDRSRVRVIPFPQKNSLPCRVRINFQDFPQKMFEHQSRNTARII